jgi:Heparinase II/III-like protein
MMHLPIGTIARIQSGAEYLPDDKTRPGGIQWGTMRHRSSEREGLFMPGTRGMLLRLRRLVRIPLLGMMLTIGHATDLTISADLQALLRVPVPPAGDFATHLRPGHPRISLTPGRIEELRALVQQDPVAGTWYRGIQAYAAWYEAQADIAYVPEPVPGERAQVRPMLWPGRDFVDRVYTLGLVASLGDDARAAGRLKQEVLHALDTWKDWSGSIATFEIAAGMGLAYDWLYNRWTPEERVRIRATLERIAFTEYRDLYQSVARDALERQPLPRNNVALVECCGAAVAALAIAEDEPKTAGAILATSFAVIQTILRGFGDQGSWFEGLNYWNFGVRHLVQYLNSLDTATGGDFGLVSTHQFPGVEKTAYFPLNLCGPTGTSFNYADTYEGTFTSPSLLWLGTTYRCTGAWQYEERLGRTLQIPTKVTAAPTVEHPRNLALRLLYFQPLRPETLAPAPQPLDMVYSGDEVASLRSSWEDPGAIFVGIKGGSAKGNPHAHLDAGTVILEAFGRRWLSEIPPPHYGRGGWPYAKRYMNDERFLFFQTRTEAHNTLLIDPNSNSGGNQSRLGNAIIGQLRSSADAGSCEMDLTSLYPAATSAIRCISLFERRTRLELRDVVSLKNPAPLRWHVYTTAPLVLPSEDGRAITLKFSGDKNPNAGERVEILLRSTDQAQRFAIEAAEPIAESPAIIKEKIPGFTRLAIILGRTAEATIDVEFRPWRE